MSNSVRPHGRQPTRLPRPWDSPGKNTGVGCHFLLQCLEVKSESEVTQWCLTPSDPMDHSLPGSSVHGILQARVLEWVAIAFSNTPHYSTLNCFHSLKKKTKKLLLHFKCRPHGTQVQCHSTGSTTPPGKQVGEPGAPVTTGRAPGRYSGSPRPLQNKSQEPGPELSL